MRELKAFRIDTSQLPAARANAGLPADAPEAVVMRVALALLAGEPITEDVLSTKRRARSAYRKTAAA